MEFIFLSCCKQSHIKYSHNFVTFVSSFSIVVFFSTCHSVNGTHLSSISKLAKLTTSLALYQGISDGREEMMLESSSSSGTSSSSSSSSSSLASEMDLDQALDINPILLKLIYMTTTLNEKINSTILDGGISWGCTLTILDLLNLMLSKIAIYVRLTYKL